MHIALRHFASTGEDARRFTNFCWHSLPGYTPQTNQTPDPERIKSEKPKPQTPEPERQKLEGREPELAGNQPVRESSILLIGGRGRIFARRLSTTAESLRETSPATLRG